MLSNCHILFDVTDHVFEFRYNFGSVPTRFKEVHISPPRRPTGIDTIFLKQTG